VRGKYKGDLHTVTITSSTHEAGFSGTETLVATTHERMRVERTKANFEKTELILNGEKVWAKDANGFVLELTGPDAEATISEYFEAAFPLLDSVRPARTRFTIRQPPKRQLKSPPARDCPFSTCSIRRLAYPTRQFGVWVQMSSPQPSRVGKMCVAFVFPEGHRRLAVMSAL
jgi:hypothetical protein